VGILPAAYGEVMEILASIIACHRLIIAMVGRMPTVRDGAETVTRSVPVVVPVSHRARRVMVGTSCFAKLDAPARYVALAALRQASRVFGDAQIPEGMAVLIRGKSLRNVAWSLARQAKCA
jgi:hypothetical protein